MRIPNVSIVLLFVSRDDVILLMDDDISRDAVLESANAHVAANRMNVVDFQMLEMALREIEDGKHRFHMDPTHIVCRVFRENEVVEASAIA